MKFGARKTKGLLKFYYLYYAVVRELFWGINLIVFYVFTLFEILIIIINDAFKHICYDKKQYRIFLII